eukprot:TRINITY_DN12723_c0_g1_i1.p1 TRINITY_DN12723_c0_g1~~TRINITY_DN12723_c0_g1_i1.p1  ORF type:complete len:240 (-),score=9.66 TRINITY_DN12723_c0_g1_i1:131-850(-)
MPGVSLETWWKAMKRNHAALGLFSAAQGDPETGHAFTFPERCLFLTMSFADAWFGVYAKYFYLPDRVSFFVDQLTDTLQISLGDSMIDHIDTGVCAILGGSVDVLLGKELVRKVMSKDWERKGGTRGFASWFVMVFAIFLIVLAKNHMLHTLLQYPQLQSWFISKWLKTCFLKIFVIETVKETVKVLAGNRAAIFRSGSRNSSHTVVSKEVTKPAPTANTVFNCLPCLAPASDKLAKAA